MTAILLEAIVSPHPLHGAAGDPPLPAIGDTAAGGHGQVIDGVGCDSLEHGAYHLHAHLSILLDGRPRPVPALVGIPGGPGVGCFYWMHTHDSSGLLHLESPEARYFTLGQFFDIWGEPLRGDQVTNIPVRGRGLHVFVDGQSYTGDPRDIQLKGHTEIVIEVGTEVLPPPAYSFPPGY